MAAIRAQPVSPSRHLQREAAVLLALGLQPQVVDQVICTLGNHRRPSQWIPIRVEHHTFDLAILGQHRQRYKGCFPFLCGYIQRSGYLGVTRLRIDAIVQPPQARCYIQIEYTIPGVDRRCRPVTLRPGSHHARHAFHHILQHVDSTMRR